MNSRMDEVVASAIVRTLETPNNHDRDLSYETVNIVDGVYQLARAIERLGNADAATQMGGMEALGKAMLASADIIAGGLRDLADAIRERS